ncbi:MAG: radical SAM protein, partial [Deltaproteobacteria bacterium]|nr:radical SAM protein [Deltaproteobacteria bacterium]
ADHVCREEGVRFIRRLLGENELRPIVPAHSPVTSSRVLGFQQKTVVGHVTAGLGCANGCDFCCTSHFFRRKYVKLRGSGSDIYDAMMETKARAERDGQKMASFAIIDEDFFLQKKRALEFLEAVRRGGKPLSIFGFGSIKGLSQFTADEIAEMGFDLIWTAFEGKKSGYAKLDGKPIAELYTDLHARGVGVLSSMIIGFPYQDEGAIRAEFEDLMSLGPDFVQILIYFAFPGTPFFEQVLRDGRFLPRYAKSADLRRWDGFALHLDHPHFTPEKLEALQKELYAQDFRRLGPSLHRLTRTWLRGIENLRGSNNALLRARAERLRNAAHEVYPTLKGARWLLPSPQSKRRLDALYREMGRVVGPPSLKSRLMVPGSAMLAAWAEATERLGVLQQPALLRAEHHTDADGERVCVSDAPGRLQGIGASVLGRLREDFQHLVVDRLRPPAHDATGPVEGWKPVGRVRTSLHVISGEARCAPDALSSMEADAAE